MQNCLGIQPMNSITNSDSILKSFCTGLFSTGVSVLILSATIKFTRTFPTGLVAIYA